MFASINLNHYFRKYKFNNRETIMAMAITNIPVLTGKEAERFIQLTKQAEKERHSIDFSKEREMFRKMLEKKSNE